VASNDVPAAGDFRAYAAALISAATRREVGRAFVDAGVAACGARSGTLYLARNGALHLLAVSGACDDALVPCRVMPLSASTPAAEMFRTLEPAWLGSAGAIEERSPALHELLGATGDAAWAAMPLTSESGWLGVVELQFADPQAFDQDQRAFLLELAGLTARALQRAGRHDEECETRTFQHRLIGIAGHELRNPLTVVLSSAEHLARGATGDRDKRASARLLRNARRMDRVVRDLVDYAQAQAEGRLHIAPREVDFHELCVRVLASLSSLHPERPVTYQRGEEGRGRWDPDRLEELLENLLVNALRYGAADRPVYVGWYGEPTELVLKVHNDGPPIAAAVLPHVFDPFRRGEEHSVRNSLGLGLYIVRQIVAAHGGRVDVRSDREAGTTFVVRLPFQAPATGARDLAG
jgi:signal transduction histidine kinase